MAMKEVAPRVNGRLNSCNKLSGDGKPAKSGWKSDLPKSPVKQPSN